MSLSPIAAHAQASFVTPNGGGNNAAQGALMMCLNNLNQAVPCGAAAPLQTGGAASTAVSSFQQTPTSTAAPLTNGTFANGIVICAAKTNTGNVYVGGSGVTASTGFPIGPNAPSGQNCMSYGVTNSNQVYIVDASSGDSVFVTGN